MKLIIGLGNPGIRYRNTKHNVGFLVVKGISAKLRIPVRKKKSKGLSGIGSIGGEKTILFVPLTFMNLSGEAVREIVKKEKVPPEDILVIYDDIDLKLGAIRLRRRGSSGGHKGLASIIGELGTYEFARLRVGIAGSRRPSDAAAFVLAPFKSDEKALLKHVLKEACECADVWLKEGSDKAMTRFNKS